MYGKVLKRFIGPGLALLAVCIIGTVGYWAITDGQHSFLDTFYMTLITISTIGFGEVIDIAAIPAARVFTIFIAIAGVGVLFYIITNVTALLVEGELTKSFRRNKMENKARNYKGHYIICGIGDLGLHIADELAATNRPHVIVDHNKETVDSILEADKDKVVIVGDATDNSALEKAGIAQAVGLFAALGEDNHNLVVVLSAKQLNPDLRIVSRCNELKNRDKMIKAGADTVISPYLIGGLRMASEMLRPTVVTFLDTMLRDREQNLRVEEINVPDSLAGQPISVLKLDRFPSILLVAIRARDNWTYNPSHESIMEPESTLVFIGGPEDRRRLEQELHKTS